MKLGDLRRKRLIKAIKMFGNEATSSARKEFKRRESVTVEPRSRRVVEMQIGNNVKPVRVFMHQNRQRIIQMLTDKLNVNHEIERFLVEDL